MTGMHHMLVHFPIAFWALATLLVLLAVLGRGRAAQIAQVSLLPLLLLSLLGALVAIVSGFLVWPWQANLYSPMVRNHILMAFWALAVWSMLTVLLWRAGKTAFNGKQGWTLVFLALLGSGLFAITGTLGGHLAGAPTAFSQLIAALGWKLYNTFYLPSWALLILVLVGLGCVLVGVMGRRRSS